MLKFLHTADLHLGESGGGALPEELANIRQREIRGSLKKIVDLALAENVELLLIAGDLFTQRLASPALLRYANEEFLRFGKKVLISAGNHDPRFPSSPAAVFPWCEHVFFFPPNQWQQLTISESLAITGLSWGRESPKTELLVTLPKPQPAAYNILLLHGSFGVDGLAEDYFPLPKDALLASGYDYVALGHFHRARIWEEEGTTIAYSGSPEALNFFETGPRGVLLGEIENGKLALEFKPIATRQYWQLEREIGEIKSEGELAEELAGILLGKEEDLVRLTLRGTLPQGFALDLDPILAELQAKVFYLELCSNLKEELTASDLPPGSLREIYFRKLSQELEQAETPRQRRLLELALEYGLKALSQGKINLRRGFGHDH